MTTKINKLRVAMLERPELFDAVRLTKQQREAVQWARVYGAPCVSGEVAAHLGVSVPHASNLLKAGHAKGYLARHNIGDKTGGTQWAYMYALATPAEPKRPTITAEQVATARKLLPDPRAVDAEVWRVDVDPGLSDRPLRRGKEAAENNMVVTFVEFRKSRCGHKWEYLG